MTLALVLFLLAVPRFEDIAKQASDAREANRDNDAIRLYKQAVRLRPTWTEGWWYLATLDYDRDQYAEGRDAFRKFVELDPKTGPGWALLGLCEFQLREYEPALGHLRQAETLGFGANEQIQRVALYHIAILLTRFEQYEMALAKLNGEARLETKESATSIEAMGIAALRRPLLPAEVPPQDHELVMALGRAVYLMGLRRAAEADQAFKELLARYPNTPNVHFAYGYFLQSSDPDGTIREVARELEISPRHLPALVQLAIEYEKRGDTPIALKYARRAVEVDPGSFAARTVMGRLLLQGGDTDGAVKELELARKIAPNSPQTRIALASAYAKAGRKDDAAHERAEFLKLKTLAEEAGKK